MLGGEITSEENDKNCPLPASSVCDTPLHEVECQYSENTHEASVTTVVRKTFVRIASRIDIYKANWMAMCGALCTSVINGAFLVIFVGAIGARLDSKSNNITRVVGD